MFRLSQTIMTQFERISGNRVIMSVQRMSFNVRRLEQRYVLIFWESFYAVQRMTFKIRRLDDRIALFVRDYNY